MSAVLAGGERDCNHSPAVLAGIGAWRVWGVSKVDVRMSAVLADAEKT